jgi:serine/threonine-protein kinase HipA
MPLAREPYSDGVARPFFSGLLPDDLARRRLAQNLGVSEKNPLALLEVVGKNCAGAVAMYPEGEKPHPVLREDCEILDDGQLLNILKSLHVRPLLAGEEGMCLSLAGAQDKLAVGVWVNPKNLSEEKIALMKNGAPTTHIIKTPIEGFADSVHNEYFCLKLAAELRLPVANANIRNAGDMPYLLVTRYDRECNDEGDIIRIHQEDFCQALSVPPENKYEREDGPCIGDCVKLLERGSSRPAADKTAFMNLLIFNYLIGNADCHAKNFSFLYLGGKPRLSPAYDLICTAVYPELRKKMAMKIGGEYDPEKIFRRHWHRIVEDTAMARKVMDKSLEETAKAIIPAAEKLVEEMKSKDIYSPIFGEITDIIGLRARHILSEL